MLRKLLASSIAATTAVLSCHTFGKSQNGQQTIEEIEVFADSRRAEGLTNVNAAISVLGEEELDLILQTHYQEALARVPGFGGNRNNGQES